MKPNNQDGICSRIGCGSQGHLSQRLGSSMFSYRMIVCDEHEKELYETA